MARQSSRQQRRAAARRDQPAHRSALRLPAFLAAVFAIKLIVLLQLQSHPLLQPDAGLDTTAYLQLARRVGNGDLLLGPGLYYLSPLYVYFLAGALSLGDSLTWIRVLQAGLGTGAVYGIFVATRAWFGERAGWIGGTLAALTGVITFYEIVVLQSALDPVLTASALACLAVALRSGDDRAAAIAGLALGLQGLNRPNVLLAVPVVLFAIAAARRPRLAALVLAGLLAGLAPVVIRNLLVSHQFALGSSQGGLNLYIGNREGASGQYLAIPGIRANIEGQSEDTRRVAEQATGHALTDAQVSNYFTGLALGWVRGHPATALELLGKKLALVFSAQHQWLDFSYPYYARDLGTLLQVLVVGPWLLVPFGLAGLLVGYRRSGAAFLAWAVFIPAYAVAVAVFFVGERYRLPLLVALCVTSGGALDAAVSALQARTLRVWLWPGVVFAGALVVCLWPHRLNDGRYDERLRLSKVLMNRGDFSGATDELRHAYEIDPSQTVTEFNLGMALVSAGNAAEGLPHVRHAVDAGVPMPGSRYALVGAMLRSGDVDGAARLLRSYTPQPSDTAESCVQVASLAMQVHAPDVAERYLRRAVELRPDWDVPRNALREIGR